MQRNAGLSAQRRRAETEVVGRAGAPTTIREARALGLSWAPQSAALHQTALGRLLAKRSGVELCCAQHSRVTVASVWFRRTIQLAWLREGGEYRSRNRGGITLRASVTRYSPSMFCARSR